MNIKSQSVLDRWAKISPYLDRVLAVEPEDRHAWLADLQKREPRVALVLRTHLVELAQLNARNFMEVAIPARLIETDLAGR